jgi:hypothetical protein
MTDDARDRENIGRCAPSPVRQSRTQPHRQHLPAITACHVLAFICESLALDRLCVNRSSQLALPRGSGHQPDAVPAESPTPLLVLQVFDTPKQQEKVRRGAGAECGDTTAGKAGRRKANRQSDGDTACDFYE